MSSTAFLFVTLYALVLCLATPTSAKLSDDEQFELIKAHNFYRSKAQPTPTDMVALVSKSLRGKEFCVVK